MKSHVLTDLVLLPLAIIVWTSLGVAQTPTNTRIEETDKSIIYSGPWYINGNPTHSGGGAALANAPGSTATVNFSGTGITWIGVLDAYSGIANVFLDGVMSTVDTYNSVTRYQQPLFTAQGLPNGPHTLAIEVTSTRNPSALGGFIWVDAFDIQNGSAITGGFSSSIAYPGRTEQNSASVAYAGTWFTNASAVLSGNSAAFANAAGSSATVTFSGTGITWIGYRDANSGTAQVYLDGVLTATVDTYLSPVETQTPVYSVNGLVPGQHTLAIVVTGAHNASSGGSWVWVDAFDVGSGSPGASTNVAQGKPATQSSTYPSTGTGAASAVDGSTDGNFFDGSVATTNLDNNAWWQVDLGISAAIRSIVIWNRTDCCASRLNDYWVFVSDTPFSPTDTPATLANRPGTWSSHQTATPSPSSAIAAGAQGRYVRVQLTGANYLSLAEVQVLQ